MSTLTAPNQLAQRRQQSFAKTASEIRRLALHMTHHAKASHIGSCLSMADLLAVLYDPQFGVLRLDPSRPDWDERDRFLLSKGHAAAALYAALVQRGFLEESELNTYCEDGTRLSGHISHYNVPGIELSTGSLGHALSVACGMACATKVDERSNKVVCLLSDGECNEGSNWEAIMFAPHHRLDNLVVIVDHNKIQSFGTVAEVLDLHPFADKWRAFNWAVHEIDGHDTQAIHDSLTTTPWQPGKPSVIIAHTVKGKGVAFMENQLAWHYKSVSTEQLDQALTEVSAKQ